MMFAQLRGGLDSVVLIWGEDCRMRYDNNIGMHEGGLLEKM